MNLIKKMLCAASLGLFAAAASADVNVIWYTSGNESTILNAFDGTSTKQLSPTGFSAKLSGNNIAFFSVQADGTYSLKQSKAGVVTEIDKVELYGEHSVDGNNTFYRKATSVVKYNGTSAQTIWDSGSVLSYPIKVKGSGNTIVFQVQNHAENGYARHYYIYDGANVQNLNTLTGTSEDFQMDFDVSGKNVVWGHDNYAGTVSYIDFWDGRTAQTIKSSTYLYTSPKIDGNNVVFVGRNGTNYEIFLWDGATTKQITNSLIHKSNPQISGNMIVWQANDGTDEEVFAWDGTKVTQLTNNATDDTNPQVSNGYVVWSGFDGNDNEIFMWDGKTTKQLTNNTGNDFSPQVSASTAVVTPEVANGTYLIQNKFSGKYLNRNYSGTANGTLVHVWSCSTCVENKWIVTRLPEGGYKLTAVNAPAQGLDINGNAEGAPAQMWYFWGQGANQKFNLVKAAAGTFYVSPLSAPGKVLEVGAGQAQNGAKVVQKTLTSTSNQQWIFVPTN
jgi:hypothetical protein